MASTSVQNISTNSSNPLSKEEHKKLIVNLHEANNSMKLVIDGRQKSLAEMRQSIPEECRQMFEEEKKMLLKHYTTAELLPHLSKKGPTEDEIQRMITNIKERVDTQIVDQEETKILKEQTEKLRQESEYLRQKIRNMATEMLKESEN